MKTCARRVLTKAFQVQYGTAQGSPAKIGRTQSWWRIRLGGSLEYWIS